MMQRTIKEYDPVKHDLFRAFTVLQDWGDKILSGGKTIEVRKSNPHYIGRVIVTTAEGDKPRSGIAIAEVELYKIKPLSELTNAEWGATGIKKERRRYYHGFAWFLRNPKPVRPLKVRGYTGLWTLILDKGELKKRGGNRKILYWIFAFIIALGLAVYEYFIN